MKLSFVSILILCCGLFLLSCSEEAEGPVKTIQEARSEGEVSVADIIRNPVTANQPVDTSQLARITFQEQEYDFGQIKQGEKVSHRYDFVNTGNVPLLINSAKSTCGCTVPEWPKELIAPGGKGSITVQFNSENKTGTQRKPVTIFANTNPQQTVVYISGTVQP